MLIINIKQFTAEQAHIGVRTVITSKTALGRT